MSFYTPEQLRMIGAEFATLAVKWQQLLFQYTQRPFSAPRAREFASQGFSRRLKTLVHCIDKVFEVLPPDFQGLPSEQQCYEATINIQAFVFNVFGSIDNLAWI